LTKVKDAASDALQNTMLLVSEFIGSNLSMGLGITYNGQEIYKNVSGPKSLEGEPATEDTVISIGSITKIFTSLMMNALAEEDVLDVTDPVTMYYSDEHPPKFNPVNPYGSNGADAVTLESLSSQSSGLARESYCPLGQNCSEEDIISLNNINPLFHTPMTRPHYSNFGFSLLGRACARAASYKAGSEVKYEDWIVENILEPFDMKDSGFDYTEEVKEKMATGYTKDDKQLVVDPLWAKTLYWSNPAGGMHSTLSDMLKFATHLATKSDILSPNGYQQYFMPGPPMSDGVSSYGKSGWEVMYSNGFRVLTKGGLVGGFGTQLVVLPELKLGMFAFINAESGGIPSKLTAEVFNAIVPMIKEEIKKNQPKREVPEQISKMLGKYVDLSSQQCLLSISEDTATPETGVFVGQIAGMEVTFEFDSKTTKAVNQDNVLFFRCHSVPYDAESCFYDAFTFEDALVKFYFDQKSNNWMAFIPDIATRLTRSK